ncbi:MAG: tRNA(Ile)(2)-agmatinylcytidine synthase, partial [Thermoplasmata archaeon]|nr:tRNA(Ile)(2)-agmatinylcytidine synthase [Thermoplasmata archaeon]
RFGKGIGKPTVIGRIDGRDILCYETGTPARPNKAYFERACALVERLARFEDPKTNPGVAMSLRKPPADLYWKAVRDVVELKPHLKAANPDFSKGWKNKRGLIGAVSAMAWRPHDRTYELIAYREPKKWGTPRTVDEASVIKMDKKFTGTFNNYDYEEKHVVFAPASPCPILFGIRGDAPGYLRAAMETVKSEKVDRWLIFLTNQGTDDHIIDASVSNLRPFTSARVRGTVAGMPRIIEGGHLIFPITNGRKAVDCTIYEPAKSFRQIGYQLRPGDIITVQGAVRESPPTINVEKLCIEKLANVTEKTANPICPECKKRMKSYGKGQGYRCARCGAKSRDAEYSQVKRNLEPGWYEPPAGAMRHLAKPLKRRNLIAT